MDVGVGSLERVASRGWRRRSRPLQVLEDNAPARELCARSGFTEHHRYHYRRAPLG